MKKVYEFTIKIVDKKAPEEDEDGTYGEHLQTLIKEALRNLGAHRKCAEIMYLGSLD